MILALGAHPKDPTPTAVITPKKIQNCHNKWVKLHRARPVPLNSDPNRQTIFGLKRSTKFPTRGLIIP